MSHYIYTTIKGKEILLTGGSSNTTIRATAYTGFDIYDIFYAYSFNGGMSGTGECKKIDFKIAENAYKNAIAWAKALEQSFPEHYKDKCKDYQEYREDFPNYLSNHFFNDEELKKLIEEKRKFHNELNEDQIKRSFYLLYGILYFTYHVYAFTEKGNDVEIGFT